MSAADPRAVAANQRLADQVASCQAGHLAAAKLVFAINEGLGDPVQLMREAIDAITATRDPDRIAAFHRTVAKAVRR